MSGAIPTAQEGQPQENLDPSGGEALSMIRRALRYVAPFGHEFRVKIGLMMLSLLPMVLLPWPIRVVIDHVIGDANIAEPIRPFPFFVQPFIDMLVGASKLELLIASVSVEFVLLVLVGAFGTAGRERSTADAYMAGGQDSATQTENEANSGFSLIGGVLGLIDFRYTMRLTQKLNHHYRSRLYERMQSLPMTTFDDERIGDAVYRVMYDTPAITNVCYRVILTPLGAPAAIVLIVTVLSEVYGAGSPVVMLAVLFLPVVLIATLPFATVIRRRGSRSRGTGSTTTTTVEEGMSNIVAVQSLGGEGRERERFDEDSEGSFKAFRRLVAMGMASFLTATIAGMGLTAWVFLYVGDNIIDGHLSVGDLAVLLPYFSIIATSSVDLGALWVRIQESSTGLGRVFFLMDLPSEADSEGSDELATAREVVAVESVGYAYEQDHPILSGVSFEARRGQLTAFVGPAGAGKTTLAYMIPRFLVPDSGRVTIDGVDTADVTLSSLRKNITFVFQETALFDATVEQNLRLGNPDATAEEMRAACTTAGIADFIDTLPDGYRTRLGRAGGKLSVGQKQRLSIARALVCDAPIMIFDEPTSALDSETEARVAAALLKAAEDRIVIVIAHRLSTVRNAGKIIFLQDGRILEQGSHVELMGHEGGPYRRFVELQTGHAAA